MSLHFSVLSYVIVPGGRKKWAFLLSPSWEITELAPPQGRESEYADECNSSTLFFLGNSLLREFELSRVEYPSFSAVLLHFSAAAVIKGATRHFYTEQEGLT